MNIMITNKTARNILLVGLMMMIGAMTVMAGTSTKYEVPTASMIEAPGEQASNATNPLLIYEHDSVVGILGGYQLSSLGHNGGGGLALLIDATSPNAVASIVTDNTSTPAKLYWSWPTDNLTGTEQVRYNVYRSTSNALTNPELIKALAVSTDAVNGLDVTGVLGYTRAYYMIQAVDLDGNHADSAVVYMDVAGALARIPDLTLTKNATQTDVILSWSAISGSAGYRIYRSASPTFNAQTLQGEIAGLTFTDSGAIGGTWFYKVVAIDGSGTEAPTSNIGYATQIALAPNASNNDLLWFALPYRNTYISAMDIVNELGGDNSQITQIGKWDYATQTYETMSYVAFTSAWNVANDFVINAGDAIYVDISGATTINIVGSYDSVAFNYPLNATNSDLAWLSLPYNAYLDAYNDLIADEFNGDNSKATQIGKWNYATQTYDTMSYVAFTSAWNIANNFAINPAEAIYIDVSGDIVNWIPANE